MDNYKAYATGFVGNYNEQFVVTEQVISFALGVQDSRTEHEMKTFKAFSEMLNRYLAE